MNLPPVLAALHKHKAGVFLIGLQIALTLAIVCNIIFIVGQRVSRIDRPTGMAERNLFLVSQSYVDAPSGTSPAALQKLDSMQLTDLAALRALPDVKDVTPVNSLPLLRKIDVQDVSTKPDQPHGLTEATMFYGDQNMLPTLGLRLVAGRDFTRNDVRHVAAGSGVEPPAVIVTRALAKRLYPNGNAVGQPFYINSNSQPSTVIGVVARMLTSDADGPASIAWNSVLIPARIDAASTMYAVRAKPGRMPAAMSDARKALYRVNPMRIIPQDRKDDMQGIHTFAQVRDWGYALDLFVVRVLIAISVILLAVTGVGMTGLTSFWVGQRHKQIGIRRALGARKVDILRYFQIENLVIAGGGCVAGVILAIIINLGLMRLFAMMRMPAWYVAIGVVAVLLLGQIAVFAPALRASKVPPVVATRSA